MIESVLTYWEYDFVRNALIAGSLSAVLGAVVGGFVIYRNVGFAAHALGHVGFTGATGAALLGLTPLQGMLGIACLAGVLMGISGNKINRSEMAVGMVLSLALGVGTLFLALYKGFAGQATSILFGDIFGVSKSQILQTVWLSLLSLAALGILSRRLLFASLQPDLAEARGISLNLLSTSFMIILAVSVTLASQVVGILLVFTLVIGPSGIAARLCRTFWRMVFVAITVALSAVWIGIFLACMSNWPPSFWITLLLFVAYVGAELIARFLLQSER